MHINGNDVSGTGVDCHGIGGHGELDVKRYHNDTRHMIIYAAYCDSPMGEQGGASAAVSHRGGICRCKRCRTTRQDQNRKTRGYRRRTYPLGQKAA